MKKLLLIMMLSTVLVGIHAAEVTADVAAQIEECRMGYLNNGRGLKLRETALFKVGSILESNPNPSLAAEVLTELQDLCTSPEFDWWLQAGAVRAMGLVLKGNPNPALTAKVLAKLQDIYTKPASAFHLSISAIRQVGRILQDAPNSAAANKAVTELRYIYNNSDRNFDLQIAAVNTVGRILQENRNTALAAEVVDELLTRYKRRLPAAVEAEGRILLGHFNHEKAEEYLEKRGRRMGVDPEVITALEKRLSARFAEMEIFARAWQQYHGKLA